MRRLLDFNSIGKGRAVEVLTAAKKRSIHMMGVLNGLRRARAAIVRADGLSSVAADNCRAIIDHEIQKIMTLPEHHFE